MTERKDLLRDIEEILVRTKEADFADVGGFSKTSPAERLEWLDEAAAFVSEFKGCAAKKRGSDKP